MRRSRIVPWLLLAAALAALVARAGGGTDREGQAPDARGRAAALPGERPNTQLDGIVSRITDGDTIRVRIGSAEERVRYIGMDTPETHRPGTPVQCFGPEATRYNAQLVANQRVRLVLDAETRDRYGRLLAYVYRARDGLFVNAQLVRAGYAAPLTIPPDVAHADDFVRLAREARERGRGLWSACR
jgi:micrococcal nuclease